MIYIYRYTNRYYHIYIYIYSYIQWISMLTSLSTYRFVFVIHVYILIVFYYMTIMIMTVIMLTTWSPHENQKLLLRHSTKIRITMTKSRRGVGCDSDPMLVRIIIVVDMSPSLSAPAISYLPIFVIDASLTESTPGKRESSHCKD